MSTFLFNNANYSRTQPHRKLNTCRSNNITIKLNTKHTTSAELSGILKIVRCALMFRSSGALYTAMPTNHKW